MNENYDDLDFGEANPVFVRDYAGELESATRKLANVRDIAANACAGRLGIRGSHSQSHTAAIIGRAIIEALEGK
jgi:hypothetical protein